MYYPFSFIVSLIAFEILSAAAWPSFHNPLQQPLRNDPKDTPNLPKDARPGSRGAVASESSVCSQIGIDLLQKGGTAADAMVGTTLCVGVIGMYHSGIGGGGFMLVRSPDGEYEVIDFREAAPAAAFEEMYRGNEMGSVFGGLAVGVPGDLKGLQYLHRRYGSLPWKNVVMPAATVAREGFIVTEDLVRYMDSATSYVGSFLTENPVWAEDFAPNGTLVVLGDHIARKRYANTLERIANEGVDIFYNGDMAESMVKVIRDNNGSMTLDDFNSYSVIVREAVTVPFRGLRLFSTGAPSSGAIVLSILQTMAQFPATDNADSHLSIHRFDEALRFGYGARTHLGDPDFLDGQGVLEAKLLSRERAQLLRRQIRNNTTLPVEAYNPARTATEPGHGTSHVVTADNSGLAISSTTTINTLFGSLLMDPITGVILNNEMNDFSIPRTTNEFGYPPSPANFIRPGKRPLSSITPIMAEDGITGALVLVCGAAGGSRIISTTAQVAWNVLEHGLDMQQALAAPRLHDQLAPNTVTFETDFGDDIVASMAAKGHHIALTDNIGSSAQGIRLYNDGIFEATGEPRQHNSGGEVW